MCCQIKNLEKPLILLALVRQYKNTMIQGNSETSAVADNNGHVSMDDSISETKLVAESNNPVPMDDTIAENDIESVKGSMNDAESIPEEDNYMNYYDADRIREEVKLDSRTSTSGYPYIVAEWSDDFSQELLAATTRKKCIIILICLIGMLILAAGIAIVIALMQISEISREFDLVQSTLPSMDTITANNANITMLMINVKLLEDSITRRYGNELDMLNKLNNQLTANVTRLVLNAMVFQSTSATNFIEFNNVVNNRLENVANTTSSQLSVFNQNIFQTNQNINLTEAVILEVLTNIRYSFPSCATIQQEFAALSGNFLIMSSNGSSFNAYCDMTRTCDGITGGWMRVGYLNLTNTTTQCPDNLELLTTPIRTCITPMTEISSICFPTIFTVNSFSYSQVCGRVIGYQVGSPDAFDQGRGIDSAYLDGVSLTYGTPRKHIWSFVTAVNENRFNIRSKCPCINSDIETTIQIAPSFVGNDYFCDTAFETGYATEFLEDNPLWDGDGCGPKNTCCSFNNPPWFYKQLPQSTTDDIEMRVCRDQGIDDENVAFEIVEIYVQ